jgi:hypothetical protein
MPWTPLHIAIADEADLKVHEMAQDGTILQWLNETDEAGVTPLHLASETEQTAIVQVRANRSPAIACRALTQNTCSCSCHSAATPPPVQLSTTQRLCTSPPKKDAPQLSPFLPTQAIPPCFFPLRSHPAPLTLALRRRRQRVCARGPDPSARGGAIRVLCPCRWRWQRCKNADAYLFPSSIC